MIEKKPGAILLCESTENMARVYGLGQMERLRVLTVLQDGPAITLAELETLDLRGVQAVFSTWGMPAMAEEEIARHLPDLRAVFYAAGSVQHFARPFLSRGVRVYSAWRANAVPVARYTFAQILLACKGTFNLMGKMRASRSVALELFAAYPGCHEVRIGLLGLGAIGEMVANMLRPMGLTVLAFSGSLTPARAAALGVIPATMEEIFASCTVISNHLANVPGTQGIITRAHLLSMPPNATFINTGRGAQLCEEDLYDALAEHPARTALLDVLIDEEHADQNPLRLLPNCFITPHIAGASGNEVHMLADTMLDAFAVWHAGAETDCEVKEDMLLRMA